MASVTVFISHSHHNRDVATDLQRILLANQAEVFLDQDEIAAGDQLPAELTRGINACNRFLLLWSSPAQRSKWVQLEWDYAFDLRKKIIPYRLDGTPLPDALENFVHVDSEDRKLGDGNLLTAIFGKEFKPQDSTQLFPGLWRARLAVAGLGEATYDIELRRNGQLTGSGSMGSGGVFGDLATQMGLGHLLNAPLPLHGSWTYDDGARNLKLDISVSAFGRVQREVINILTTGKEQNALKGTDLTGRRWIAERRDGPGVSGSKPMRTIGGGSYLDGLRK